MKTRQPGLHQLNREMIEETIYDLKNIGLSTESVIELCLAQTIIINTLGGDFWAKECTTFGLKQNFFQEKADTKQVHLAGMLWNLKNCYGFKDFLKKNNNNDFESTYYECLAAHWFLRESRDVGFVIPNKKRGADFDLKVTSFNGYDCLNVEVKARREHFCTEKNALNFLNKTRTQLPSNGSGAVLCKIKLSNDGITQEQLVNATTNFILNTNRVDLVIYCWDEADAQNALMYKYFSIDRSGKIERLFKNNLPLFSLTEIVKK